MENNATALVSVVLKETQDQSIVNWYVDKYGTPPVGSFEWDAARREFFSLPWEERDEWRIRPGITAVQDAKDWCETAHGQQYWAFWNHYTDYERAIKQVLYKYEEDHELVKDLFHDTFVDAWEAYPEFEDESAIGTWLVKCAENRGKMHVRSTQADKRKNEVSECYLDPVTDEEGEFDIPYYDQVDFSTWARESTENLDPLAEVEAEDTYEAAKSAMPAKAARALDLRRKGYSNTEVAEILGCAEKTVRNLMSMARDYFRDNPELTASNSICERDSMLSQEDIERAQRQRVRTGLVAGRYKAVRERSPDATLSEWKGMYDE